ncbi:MAG: biopolymer transporter ExbD [Nevskiaceae bacterium]|nr:biopolymer transporter ExbD [Nevskiaceae bacterium]
MNLRPRRRDDPEINLISLIDVLLVLVIFFMLSSTFVNEGRMRVRLPAAGEQPSPVRTTERITVTVTQQGGFRVNERELINSARETLQAAVQSVAGNERNARIVLRADARAQYQSVVTAMDVLGRMGFSQIDVATVDQPAPAPAP